MGIPVPGMDARMRRTLGVALGAAVVIVVIVSYAEQVQTDARLALLEDRLHQLAPGTPAAAEKTEAGEGRNTRASTTRVAPSVASSLASIRLLVLRQNPSNTPGAHGGVGRRVVAAVRAPISSDPLSSSTAAQVRESSRSHITARQRGCVLGGRHATCVSEAHRGGGAVRHATVRQSAGARTFSLQSSIVDRLHLSFLAVALTGMRACGRNGATAKAGGAAESEGVHHGAHPRARGVQTQSQAPEAARPRAPAGA